MKVTIKDIAKVANVSPSTVSRALAGSSLISEATQRNIKRIASNLGYSPNGLARGLVKRRSNLLGLLVPDIANPFFAEWALAAEVEATRHGYSVILGNTMRSSEQEDAKIRSLLEMRVAGLFVCSLNVRNPTVIGLASIEIPAVFCDVGVPGVEKAYLIHGRDPFGAELATRHLVSLGRRRICHIAGTSDTLATDYRLQGFKNALEAAGRDSQPRQIVHAEYSERGGFAAMQRLLEDVPDVDAVFAANDLIAIGAIEAIQQSGRTVPGDISVVGYDDIRLASLVRPRLTTVRQSATAMGEQGMRMLLQALESPTAMPRHAVIEPTLVIRDSCGGVRERGVETGTSNA